MLSRVSQAWEKDTGQLSERLRQYGLRSHGLRTEARLRQGFGGHPASLSGRLQSREAHRAKQDGGGRRTRTFEVIRRLIYSQLPLPLGTLPHLNPIAGHPPKRRQIAHG